MSLINITLTTHGDPQTQYNVITLSVDGKDVHATGGHLDPYSALLEMTRWLAVERENLLDDLAREAGHFVDFEPKTTMTSIFTSTSSTYDFEDGHRLGCNCKTCRDSFGGKAGD